eukprot:5499796-Pyramimonas_sp.AAC.2
MAAQAARLRFVAMGLDDQSRVASSTHEALALSCGRRNGEGETRKSAPKVGVKMATRARTGSPSRVGGATSESSCLGQLMKLSKSSRLCEGTPRHPNPRFKLGLLRGARDNSVCCL